MASGAILDADDGEGVGVEGVLAGVLGGVGFAFGSFGFGGPSGVVVVGEVAIDQAVACGWGAEMGWGCKRLGIRGRFS
jgi:hypothetical protein